MITVHFMRHAEPDYARIARLFPRFGGNRRDLAPLTLGGRQQAMQTGQEFRLTKSASLVVSSPYTRTLETAHVVASETGLPLEIDPNLHDWLAVVDGCAAIDESIVDNSIANYLAGRKGIVEFELAADIRNRMRTVVSRLAARGVEEVIIVSHQEPICLVADITEIEMGHYVTRSFS